MKNSKSKWSVFLAEKRGMITLIIFFFGIPLFLTLNLHSRTGIYNYHSELFSDKAGYQVFLPAAFIYKFDAKAFPDSIVEKTGYGFELNRTSGKVYSKFPCGTALLQLPFFLGAHGLAPLIGYQQNGFSLPYHKAIDIAGVFYFFFGIYFLQKFLRFYFPNKIFVVASLVAFSYGTNLWYYAAQDSGMSHIYSFFLFSALLYYWKKLMVSNTVTLKYICIISILSGCIALTRQFNVVYLPFVFLIDIKSIKEFQHRFLFVYKYIPIMIGLAAISLLPQIFYYHYLTGKLWVNLYQNEHFINIFSPKIVKVLFSFNNGFFSYSPIHLFTFGGLLWMVYKGLGNGRLILLLFCLITYVNAAWWCWWLGCGFGHRAFVEFYPLMMLGFLNGIHALLYSTLAKTTKYAVIAILFVFVYYGFTMGFKFDFCWFGKGAWDYNEYIRLIKGSLIP